jgi:hypothetical protein
MSGRNDEQRCVLSDRQEHADGLHAELGLVGPQDDDQEHARRSVQATDLSVSYPSSPSYSGSAETDIVYQVSTSGFSGTFIGWTWCDDAVDALRCDQHYARFRGTLQFDTELTCHESGHAVGLTHGADAYPRESDTASELGCMETPDYGNRPGLRSHNQSEINSTY